MSKLIENMAEGLAGVFAPLPDKTPIQKLVNRFYIQLRLCGMSEKEVKKQVNILLEKHNITWEQLIATDK